MKTTDETKALSLVTAANRPARPRVILAEDDPELRRLLGSSLRNDGYDVVELSDGMQLYEYVTTALTRSSPLPALIVTDVRMPGLTGLEVLETLRRSEWSLPVLLITAFGDADTHAEAQRLGAALVFDKPFDLDDFRTAVVNLVDVR